jgi:hypothetical protein
MEAQSSSSEKLGHLQKWVKKTEQPEQNGSLKGSSSLTSSEAYTVTMVTVTYIHKLTYRIGHVHTRVVCVTGHVSVVKSLGKRLCI